MQECDVVRLLCHCCKRHCAFDYLVPCKTLGCGRFFCHKCLTSRYKYSHAKISRLPSPNWRCPVCTGRCRCEECSSVFDVPVKKRGIKKMKKNHHAYRKKKVYRAKKIAGKFYLRNDANTRSPLEDRPTGVNITPQYTYYLPPISCIFFNNNSIS